MLFGLELWMALSVFPSDIRSSVAQSIGDPRVISRRRRTASAERVNRLARRLYETVLGSGALGVGRELRGMG